MRRAAARTLLQRGGGIARPELARTQVLPIGPPTACISTTSGSIYRVSRAGFTPATAATILGAPTRSKPSHLPPSVSAVAVACFHGTPAAHKKGQKSREPEPKGTSRAASRPQSHGEGGGDSDSDGPKHPAADPSAPLEFADVQSRMARHDAHYREALKRLRSGGRFNPDAIGALMVQPDRKAAAAYPLRELAQVIPRGGRTVSLLVHEESYVRGVMSAVQASEDFNQQPQRSPDNALELVLRVEPERPDDAARRLKALCHDWRDRVRSVRQRRDKLHATWQKEKLIVPDLKKTADKELDKLIKAKMAEIDAVEKEALKAAESGK
ncbi:ribosome recycling factor domain-containing protein [Biscogniauxia sp. FL1348]|nr:ribosome recycling factor domain-containing protein [Biscogniauxia sp. FL1348]